MKEYCFPSSSTTSTTIIPTKKIKQLLSELGFVCSFFLLLLKILPFFSSLMENLRPRFEAPEEVSHDEVEPEYCFKELEACNTVDASSDAPLILDKNILAESSFKVEGELGCGNLVSDPPEKWKENPDDKAMESRSRSFNQAQQNPTILRHSEAASQHQSQQQQQQQQPMISHTVSDLGWSARKGKEWRRTLACKLFQERHNVGGDDSASGGWEGMDMLWEVYERTEEEVNRGKQRQPGCNVKQLEEKIKNNRKSRIVDYLLEEEKEEEEGEDVNLCCLKALKFSAGKMHFGMVKPAGFLNFSKAFKGINVGWLNHHHHHHKKKKKKKF